MRQCSVSVLGNLECLTHRQVQAHRKYHGGEAISINLEDNGIRKQGARFLCNVRFKNDLPEVRAYSSINILFFSHFLPMLGSID
jgi:hypothetical protein